MPDDTKRYWAYVHDSEDEIIEDLGDFDDKSLAIDEIAEAMHTIFSDRDDVTYRVVDKQDMHQTCWIAGPVNTKRVLQDLGDHHVGIDVNTGELVDTETGKTF